MGPLSLQETAALASHHLTVGSMMTAQALLMKVTSSQFCERKDWTLLGIIQQPLSVLRSSLG